MSVREVEVEGAARLDRELTVALLDYEMAREDERTFVATQGAALSVAIALLAGFTAVMQKFGQFGCSKECIGTPDVVLGMAPLVPALVLTFLSVNSAASVTRYYYLRGVEAWLREKAPVALSHGPGTPIVGPRLQEIMAAQTSAARGRPIHRLFYVLFVGVVTLAMILILFAVGAHVSGKVRLLMVIVYTPLSAVYFEEAYKAILHGERHYEKLLEETDRQRARGDGRAAPAARAAPDQRSLLRYLLLPRPNDLGKVLYAPVAFAIACLVLWDAPPFWTALLQVAVLVFSLEYCLYNARYQLNDVRGFVEDGEHAHRTERRRLPHGSVAQDQRTIAISLLVAGARIGLAIATPVTFGVASAAEVVALFGALVATTVLYEALRSAEAGIGHGGRLDRAGVGWLLVGAIWLGVLPGYVLRFGAGLSLGGLPLDAPLTLLLLAAVATVAAITVFITWALEAQSTIPGERVAGPEGEKRAHLVVMRRFLPRPAPGLGPETAKTVPWLAAGSRLAAPWNVALVVGAACTVAAGANVLAFPRFEVPLPAIAGAVIGGGLVATSRWRSGREVSMALGAALVLLATRDADGALAAGGFLAIAASYNAFVLMSYDDAQEAIERLRKAAAVRAIAAIRAVASALLGRQTAGRLGLPAPQVPEPAPPSGADSPA